MLSNPFATHPASHLGKFQQPLARTHSVRSLKPLNLSFDCESSPLTSPQSNSQNTAFCRPSARLLQQDAPICGMDAQTSLNQFPTVQDACYMSDRSERPSQLAQIVQDAYKTPDRPSQHNFTNNLNYLSADQFIKEFDTFLVIDCRWPYEFEAGHVKGAVNIYNKELLEQYCDQWEETQQQMNQHYFSQFADLSEVQSNQSSFADLLSLQHNNSNLVQSQNEYQMMNTNAPFSEGQLNQPNIKLFDEQSDFLEAESLYPTPNDVKIDNSLTLPGSDIGSQVFQDFSQQSQQSQQLQQQATSQRISQRLAQNFSQSAPLCMSQMSFQDNNQDICQCNNQNNSQIINQNDQFVSCPCYNNSYGNSQCTQSQPATQQSAFYNNGNASQQASQLFAQNTPSSQIAHSAPHSQCGYNNYNTYNTCNCLNNRNEVQSQQFTQCAATSTNNAPPKRQLLCYCEFSQVRSVKIAKRLQHIALTSDVPFLQDIFILQGGFNRFYDKCSDFVEGGYLPEGDVHFDSQRLLYSQNCTYRMGYDDDNE